MEIRIAQILLVLVISLFASYYLFGAITGMFVGFGPPTNATWWNVSWIYRIRLDVNSTNYSRTDWPIEHTINFTDNLPSGTFDINSVRLVEYNAVGDILYEVPSQFDLGENYNAATNAVGELVFILNGTTGADANRTFFLYYDTTDRPKQAPGYPENINYSTGTSFTINNTYLIIYIDTQRGENTSGMSRVEDIYQNVIFYTGSGDRTAEYLEYSNYSHNVSFDLVDNYSFTNGTARLILEQIGDEILFGYTDQQTNEAYVNKKYYVYDRAGPQQYGSFIKMKQRVTNSAGSSIDRNSTPSGALAFDLNRTLNSGSIDSSDSNSSNPYSWAWASGSGGEMVGILQLSQTGTTNYYAEDSSATAYGRAGVKLNETSISSGSYIEQESLIYFSGTGGSDAVTEFYNIRDRYSTPITISQSLPERWYVITVSSTNSTTYNRNETMLITGNVSGNDPYVFTEYMNATIDMGTESSSDDQTIILYDDGAHNDYGADDDFYANTLPVSNDANVSTWIINITTYDNDTNFLNFTEHYVNVTDIYDVNVTVIDKKPIANSLVRANITVSNYIQTQQIPGAVLNCSFDSTEVTNKTDNGDGIYSVNFTSPASVGGYTLSCNATKNNNTGTGNDTFAVESAKVNITIELMPPTVNLSNITLYQNETFQLTNNYTVVGNGTAYSVNVSLELPGGWVSVPSSESCNDIEQDSFCNKSYTMTVPENTTPSTYFVNITLEWANPDNSNSTNQTTLNVTVESNPQINITKNISIVQGADGTDIHVDNFTVQSIGNDQLQKITFDCYQGTVCTAFNVSFNPLNISTLDVNYNTSVAINVSVPLGYNDGSYVGYINVTAENDNYKILELNVTIPPTTFVNITLQPTSYIAYFITQQNGENFTMNITLNNTQNSSARYTNMSLEIPSDWNSTSYFEQCGNITVGEICLKTFNISIPNGTIAGNYLLNVTSNWTNVNGSLGIYTDFLNVTVASVPLISIYEAGVSGTVSDGNESHIGNFTVLSVGNGMLQNISFTCYQDVVCNNLTVNFTPFNIPSLGIGENYSVAVNVTVPLGFLVGNYTGDVNVSAENDNYAIIDINVTVPSNRTWNLSTTFCQKSEFPDEGVACVVLVYNQGNDNITFNITAIEKNHTDLNISSNFTVYPNSSYPFAVTYNVTNVTQAPFNSTYDINAIESNAAPDNMTLLVSLLPYQPPIINLTVTPYETEQNGSVLVLANITDMSTSGIKWVNITIDNPSGFSNTTNMTLYNSSGTFYQYNFTYPDGSGNTDDRGVYNITIFADDNIGNLGNETGNFTIYTNLVISSETFASSYLQGDTASIYYTAKNLTGTGISNVNVSFRVYDSTNNVSYVSTYQTDSEGYIIPLPIFELASDAVTGNYTLVANSTYYDPVVNITFTKQKNYSFQVQQRTVTVTGLFAEIETSVIWYPNNEMRFAFLIYNGEGRPVDPDSMNLTIFDPSEDVYRSVSMDPSWKRSTGYYIYDFIMSPTTVNGMYIAVLNVSQGSFFTSEIDVFRVAQGGPYDVRLVPFEYEVQQGDFFDFNIIVENKGSVSQDVFIEYNVTDIDVNQSYFYSSEAVYTPAISNQSFTRNVYVFHNQPIGTYVLRAKVTFDYIQPPIIANVTFQVIEGVEPYVPPPPPEPEPPTAFVPLIERPEERITASLLIVGYNSNVSLARGFAKTESVTVKNDGRTNLKNVSLYILGIPTEWYIITPTNYEDLKTEDTAVFLIEYQVPENVIPAEYRSNLLATSGVISDQKTITITIYESIKELLEKELKNLKEELVDLKVETKFAEREGKDVSNVLLFINMTESYISGAEDDIKNNKPQDAMDKISNALDLIRKAWDILGQLEAPEIPPLAIPIWMIFLLFFIIIVIVFAIVYWKRKKIKPIIRPYMAPLSKLVERVKRKEVSKEVLTKEKERLSRMLKVLEKQKEEGIIGASTYNKMKKSIEKKLEKVNKKIK